MEELSYASQIKPVCSFIILRVYLISIDKLYYFAYNAINSRKGADFMEKQMQAVLRKSMRSALSCAPDKAETLFSA